MSFNLLFLYTKTLFAGFHFFLIQHSMIMADSDRDLRSPTPSSSIGTSIASDLREIDVNELIPSSEDNIDRFAEVLATKIAAKLQGNVRKKIPKIPIPQQCQVMILALLI